MGGIDREIKEYQKKDEIFSKQAERNLKGIELEKQGRVEEAIKLYEQNIEENFEGSHPYTRLAIIYSKQKRKDDEIRVLKRAIYVFENIIPNLRGDKSPKLEKYKDRLRKLVPEEEIDKILKELPRNLSDIKDAIEVLKIRYVKGEITREEFKQMKRDIED